MRALFVCLLVSLQLGVIWATTTEAPGTCEAGCTCRDDEEPDSTVTKQEGLAAAVGALTPVVLGGAGLGIFKLLKGGAPGMDGGSPDMPSPGTQAKRDSIPSYKDSPSSYHGLRRGSTPVSMFGEDDDLSFDDSPRSPRPDTSSTYTNIHRPFKGDSVNRWM